MKDRALFLGIEKPTPKFMGILNVTPDSFSDGGRFASVESAVDQGLKMWSEGADWIDIGGESTRPGAEHIPLEEEARRVLPVVEELAKNQVAISVDTTKAEIARQALKLGASMVNDVSAFEDPEMAAVCAEHRCKVCLMHRKGNPQTMQINPQYEDVTTEVLKFLIQKTGEAIAAGIDPSNLIIDPGIGFGKTIEHNLELLRSLPKFVATGFPVLIGVSRKAFIGKLLGSADKPLPVGEREVGGLAIHAYAQIVGVQFIRTHDVKSASQIRTLLSELLKPT